MKITDSCDESYGFTFSEYKTGDREDWVKQGYDYPYRIVDVPDELYAEYQRAKAALQELKDKLAAYLHD